MSNLPPEQMTAKAIDYTALLAENAELRAALEKGVGICSVGTCRQPALILLNTWPTCGEHAAGSDLVKERDELRAALVKVENRLADTEEAHGTAILDLADLRDGITALADARPDGDEIVRVAISPIPGVGIGEVTRGYVSQNRLAALLLPVERTAT